MFYDRDIDLKKLLNQKSHFLFGPRGIGKSTLIKRQLKDARIYDLLDAETFNDLARRPGLIGEKIPESNLVVIDEIQRLPVLLNEVHRLIERDGLRFLLTGSSARKLKMGASNLLGGRAWEARMFPLTSNEITDFDLVKYLNRGGIPSVWLSRNPVSELKNYTNLYIKEEIVSEAVVRKLEYFTRFIDMIGFGSGEELSYQGISSDCGVPAKTVQNYIGILEDTLLGYTLPPFLWTKSRKAITRSKFFLFDIGLVNYINKRGTIAEGSELFGKAFEHFIINEIRAWLSYRNIDENLTYWRSTSGFKVDCIVGKKVAVEIKATEMVTEKHLKGLIALKEEGMIEKFIVVSRDREKRTIKGITVYPWKTFLADLWKGRV